MANRADDQCAERSALASDLAKAIKAEYVRTVLVQREMESWRAVSEYNAIGGGPVWDDTAQRSGGWRNGQRLKLQPDP